MTRLSPTDCGQKRAYSMDCAPHAASQVASCIYKKLDRKKRSLCTHNNGATRLTIRDRNPMMKDAGLRRHVPCGLPLPNEYPALRFLPIDVFSGSVRLGQRDGFFFAAAGLCTRISGPKALAAGTLPVSADWRETRPNQERSLDPAALVCVRLVALRPSAGGWMRSLLM